MGLFEAAGFAGQRDTEGDTFELAEGFGGKGPFFGEPGGLAGDEGELSVVELL
jgi:hypothetical protein